MRISKRTKVFTIGWNIHQSGRLRFPALQNRPQTGCPENRRKSHRTGEKELAKTLLLRRGW